MQSPAANALKIFIGYDEREDAAYQVCKFSLERRSSQRLNISPISLKELRASGLYYRDHDPLSTTDFTYSRFLTPWLAGYDGWALFCDCDFLFLNDVAGLFAMIDSEKAVMCVKHDHRPSEGTKMDGQPQTVYPRKNWSSLVLYNCGHPATKKLTPDIVNTESGAFLHRFQWLDDHLIGELPDTWNWLEGWSVKQAAPPAAIHYTRGGPWFSDLPHSIDYADLWTAELAALKQHN